jgi:3-deoxy-7-phosphoheptulonate synthase
MKHTWTPDSWKQYTALQQPEYSDQQAYEQVLGQLRGFPSLVFQGEVEHLKAHIAGAGAGNGFILQGGNCAERFIDCDTTTIKNQLKILLQMSVILTHGLRKPVIRIGRIAGQYAKPRSHSTEVVKGRELPVYRGDSVNGYEPDPEARIPDPQRLLKAFYTASITLNYIRSMIDGGFADLHYPYTWNLYSIEQTPEWPDYKDVVEDILDAIHFMESFGGVKPESLGRIEMYTSHEGLLLGYEEALTRQDEKTGKYYNLGAHMVWIGNRTRDPGGAHVEYFRGIANPIGIKIDQCCSPEEISELLAVLNPGKEPGRITLITRMGTEHVEDSLPGVIRAVKKTGNPVTWSCDPMHGNTHTVEGNRKTRSFSKVLEELKTSFQIHKDLGTYLAGVHFELTGDDVTECIGGAVDLKDEDLAQNYETYCDPRLNYAQSLEMAFLIAKMLKTL